MLTILKRPFVQYFPHEIPERGCPFPHIDTCLANGSHSLREEVVEGLQLVVEELHHSITQLIAIKLGLTDLIAVSCVIL